MAEKNSITVVIPAFNEEKKIRSTINSILLRKPKNYTLDKILILSDGSTDNTVNEVNKIKNKKIILVNDSKRLGKTKRLNYAFKFNKSDILVQLDADVELKDSNTLEKLVGPFIKNRNVAIVFGNLLPEEPKTYIGRLTNFGFYSWEEAKKMVNAERYNCYGCIRAFSKDFLKTFKLPEGDQYFAEDTYSFYYAKQNNFVTHFEKTACINFKLPSTFLDHAKQMSRYLNSTNGFQNIFGLELISKYETITYTIKLKAIIKNGLKKNSLHLAVGYFVLQFATNIYSTFHKQTPVWGISESSK